MFEVTKEAQEKINEFLSNRQEKSAIRIWLSPGGGWTPSSLGLALDEPKDEDDVFDNGGVTYLIEKSLFNQIKPVQIDYVTDERGSGFSISANLSQENSCGSCSCS